jgi:uroporphyrinogen III methyltransferase/synthase
MIGFTKLLCENTSSSCVKNFCEKLGKERARSLLKDKKIACIGPITAQQVIKEGLTADVVASDYTIEGLVKAIVEDTSPQEGDHRR